MKNGKNAVMESNIRDDMAFRDILADVWIERTNANQKHGNGYGRADGVTDNLIPAMESLRLLVSAKEKDASWTEVVSEELLEAITEPDEAKREKELIQVASVCCRWVLAMRRRRINEKV